MTYGCESLAPSSGWPRSCDRSDTQHVPIISLSQHSFVVCSCTVVQGIKHVTSCGKDSPGPISKSSAFLSVACCCSESGGYIAKASSGSSPGTAAETCSRGKAFLFLRPVELREPAIMLMKHAELCLVKSSFWRYPSAQGATAAQKNSKRRIADALKCSRALSTRAQAVNEQRGTLLHELLFSLVP